MSILTKVKFIYNNWSHLEALEVPSGVNLAGYDEYKVVNNLLSATKELESREWEIHEGVSIPSEIINKSEAFKARLLEGRL